MLAYTAAMRAALLLLAIASALAGCGQTGSLYLPDESIESPVEIREKADDDEKDKKPAEPPGR